MENLGKKATDKITGFTGVITAKIFYLYGCAQYCIVPKVGTDGKRVEGEYFDEGRIEIMEQVVTAEAVQANEPGCETREYPRRA